VPYSVKLVRVGSGNVEFLLTIDGKVFAKLPFENLVKAATRIDPDHAVGAERQIQKLRRETAEAKAEMYDWQARAKQLEEKLRAFDEAAKA
jgi:glycosyltransferase involved in cell wall biosynthesis